MKVLFIGDIMGEPGRRAIARRLPKLVADHNIDVVFGNGENVAGGFGITPELAQELFEQGLAVITLGNHAWDKKEIADYIRYEPRLLRPANYPEGVPGRRQYHRGNTGRRAGGRPATHGSSIHADLGLSISGRRVEKSTGSRLRRERLLSICMPRLRSEKMAMGHYLDGDVSAVVGTHTHVQTADEQILPKGTAYLTDIGMTGPIHSVIGIKKELAIEKFLTGMPRRFEVATGPAILSAVLIELDSRLGKAHPYSTIPHSGLNQGTFSSIARVSCLHAWDPAKNPHRFRAYAAYPRTYRSKDCLTFGSKGSVQSSHAGIRTFLFHLEG